ncbi:MAG: acetyl-CoA decarbonylase/synthase complex subunit delta [Deltaproteobacteria bacterium]|nr:acetyl-CoA decarbonylase/synthase complex subunit delta [Deltaproteobacteria bacterium]
MAIEIPKKVYAGNVREITIGDGDHTIKVGGETTMPFHLFEGEMPNPPKFALEVNDVEPKEWADTLKEVYGDVWSDPAAWAKRCVELGADLIHFEMVGTDPNGMDRPAAEAADVAKKVIDAVSCPVVIWGTANHEKDVEVLRLIAEQNQDRKLILGPVEEGDYKQLGAASIGFGHTIVASSPIDVNLAKQLNILLGNLGVKDDKILIDPTVGGIGYGLEYSYSVIERCKLAALAQEDERLQFPLYCNLGREVWKTKEAKVSQDQMPELGDPKERGIALEVLTATSLLLAGGDIFVMRHPKSMEHMRKLVADLTEGGTA